MSKYYAVKGNGEKHLFTDWDACKDFTAGKKGYKFKSFSTKEEADFYLEDKDYAENAVALLGPDSQAGTVLGFASECLGKPFVHQKTNTEYSGGNQ